MKKNGYTLVELLVLIGVLGVVVFVVISQTSYAFKDNTEELYENQRVLIERQAREYAKTLETIKEDKEAIVMVSELIEKEYLIAEDGEYKDVRTGEKLNDMKIKVTYDETTDTFDASIMD